MGRRKGDKNKKPVPARERYWRAKLGADRVTGDTLRVRRSRARKEWKAEGAAWAIEARKYLASDPPDTLLTRLTKGKLARIDAGEDGDVGPEGFDFHRITAELAAIKVQSARDFAAFYKKWRKKRQEKWLAEVDEVMKLRRQRRAAARKK